MCISISMNTYGQENTPHFADGTPGKGTIEDPEEYWKINGYPDNSSFAFEVVGKE